MRPTEAEMMRTEQVSAGNPAESSKGTHPIALAVCLMVLSVCFATRATPQDQATLYFFNSSGWKVFPEKLTVLDNDKKIAAMYREYYVILPIAPGHHVLHLKEERPTPRSPRHEVILDAMPGATYYVSGGYTPNMYVFDWTFEEISKNDADKFLAKMKPQPKK
jgi:hypothetical protein